MLRQLLGPAGQLPRLRGRDGRRSPPVASRCSARRITDPVEIVAGSATSGSLVIGAVTFVIATIGHQHGRQLRLGVVRPVQRGAEVSSTSAVGGVISRRGRAVVIRRGTSTAARRRSTTSSAASGALLGPLFGVIFADYFLIRRQHVDVDELYVDSPPGRYYYAGGWNPKALIATGVAAAVSLPVALYKPWADAAPFSWFVGVVVAAGVYFAIAERDIRSRIFAEPLPVASEGGQA